MQKTICHRRVGIQYIVRDAEARMLDTNIGGELLFFAEKSGHLLPAIEEQVFSMRIGQWNRFFLGPDQMYGEYDANNCMQVDYNDICNCRFSIGDWVLVEGGRLGMVLQFLRSSVIVDFNHPLAGRQLDIEIGVIEIREDL